MNTLEISKAIPGLAQVALRERQNRGLAFAGLYHAIAGVKVAPLTPRVRLALSLVGNSVIRKAGPIAAGDAEEFIWFLTPTCDLPTTSIRRFFARRRLRRHLRKLPAHRVNDAAREYYAAQLQDEDADLSEPSNAPDYSNAIHWMAAEAGFWLARHGGLTLESYLSTPYLVLQQLERAYRASNPPIKPDLDGKPVIVWPLFLNRSDKIVADWHRAHAAEISEAIRSRTSERLPQN